MPIGHILILVRIRTSRTPYQERWKTEGFPDGGRGAAERFGERADHPVASENLNPYAPALEKI